MEKKRAITLYKDKGEPYFNAMLDGMKESPEERFVKFFENKAKLNQFLGLATQQTKRHTLTIRKAEWI